MNTLENSIRMHMRVEAPFTNNATNLAENTADVMEHMEWLDDETHVVWDVATEFFPID